MELKCQFCGKKYYRRPSVSKGSKFCSRKCHDKGKTYKKYGTKKNKAIELRKSKRMSVGDISVSLGIPYRVVARYVEKFPLTDREKSEIRDKKLRSWHSQRWPVSNSALIKRLGISRCEITGCEWTLTFELHHINGNKRDNRRKNLKVLCPNHHSITPNFRNKKRIN